MIVLTKMIKEVFMSKRVFLTIFAVCFLILLSAIARAEISASALDVVIKENNDLLKKDLANLITQFKDDINSKITSEDFRKFIQSEIKSSLQVERIKISVSVFTSVLLALVVYSLIRFKLRIKEIEIQKIKDKQQDLEIDKIKEKTKEQTEQKQEMQTQTQT